MQPIYTKTTHIDLTIAGAIPMVVILLAAEFLIALACAEVQMLPALAGWRGVLRERRWRWLRWVLTISPALFFLLRPWLMQVVSTQVSAAPWLGLWVSVMTVAPLFLLPALAACWWCLPPREDKRFAYAHVAWMACLIAVVNYAPVLWLELRGG